MTRLTNADPLRACGCGYALLLATAVAPLAAPSSLFSREPVLTAAAPAATSVETNAVTERRRGRFGAPERGVYKARIAPHWFQDNTRFWYRNDLRESAKEYIVVDAEQGTREPAFDHQKLAAALSKATGHPYTAERLPFSDIEFIDEGKTILFEAADKTWRCDLGSYECSEQKADAAAEVQKPSAEAGRALPNAPRQRERPANSRGALGTARPTPEDENSRRVLSPDSKWTALVKEHNIYLHSEEDGEEHQLSQDGEEGKSYARIGWAPDSQAFVAWRVEPGERKEVYLIESSPKGGGRAILHHRPYALPGDKFATYELSIFEVANRKQIKPEVDRFEHEWESPRLRWNRDNRHFAYEQEDRGHQRFRVIEVDSHTGTARNIIDESTETFIWTAHTENVNIRYVNWLEKTDEMIYVSERDGWRHLYLVDTKEGKIKHLITRGDYVVRGIDSIDEDKRQVWFRASGRNPGQDPYFIQYYRVNFDGTGLVALTDANGNHSGQYSPDRKYLIDTYSRADLAPIHELRRTSDGERVCQFEQADISELKATGWEPPEVFAATGRDGKTDVWGIICRPAKFDPSKRYPVLEQVYAGPQGSYVPKSFSGVRRFASLTDLGFVVAQADGMGTANRSKTFHDVCWKNLKDAGFLDRILWHRAVAAKYPWYDITRVGIYGTSAGGQSAAGALLFHPEFYKAAVANSGCHDNRMDKASWNEQWMGYPVGPQYAESSNIDNAGKLQGYLMLVVGEMDENVPPESTYRFVDALIRAGKDFDLLVVPSGGHGAGGAYGQRRLQDFFLRHLQGIELPNRNAETPGEN
ncbi:MAG TPA: prolyl oligopeptidase family serine peptidase [Candidatus Acidoferrum sp.]|jgi:dipeptidyl aminopeptidase/acylaminoacyl peptidase|nr:prolyl oligopeptidase family serine peptidase [Candidatus Acidoferrum sp.]